MARVKKKKTSVALHEVKFSQSKFQEFDTNNMDGFKLTQKNEN